MQLDPLHLDAGPESGCKAALKRDQLREHSGAPGKMHAIAALCLKCNPAPARRNLRSSAAAVTHASSLPCAVAACMLATEREEWRMAAQAAIPRLPHQVPFCRRCGVDENVNREVVWFNTIGSF